MECSPLRDGARAAAGVGSVSRGTFSAGESPAGGGRRGARTGFSLVELLVLIAVLGVTLVVTLVFWQNSRGRAETKAAARLAKVYIHKARMNSIYQGLNHFVVLDPQSGRLEIYEDTGSTLGSFDDVDRRVAATSLNAALSLPAEPASLTSPLDSTAIDTPWSLPVPDGSARWGDGLVGVMTTPTGLVQSAQSTPATIGSGVIVFSDAQNNTAAVGIRGREGTVRSFEYRNDQWKEM